jgi:LysM repeat protein
MAGRPPNQASGVGDTNRVNLPGLSQGQFVIQSFDPDFTFIGEFGDLASLPDPDSYGGWSVTSIPKRMGMTEWAGRNPMVMPVDFLIDRFLEGDGDYVFKMRDTLDKIAATASRDDEPPVCIFDSGVLVPHDYTHAAHVRWVVSGLEWNKDLTINNGGTRQPLRVGGTITLLQYNHDDIIDAYDGPGKRNRDKNKPAHQNKSNKGKPKGNTYTVKDGDTLTSIAARKLGDSKRWKEIADLNNLRSPRSIKTGQVLRMPK